MSHKDLFPIFTFASVCSSKECTHAAVFSKHSPWIRVTRSAISWDGCRIFNTSALPLHGQVQCTLGAWTGRLSSCTRPYQQAEVTTSKPCRCYDSDCGLKFQNIAKRHRRFLFSCLPAQRFHVRRTPLPLLQTIHLSSETPLVVGSIHLVNSGPMARLTRKSRNMLTRPRIISGITRRASQSPLRTKTLCKNVSGFLRVFGGLV